MSRRLVVALAFLTVGLVACGGSATPSATTVHSGATVATGTGTVPPPGATTAQPSTTATTGFAYQHLWPFRTEAEAVAWQEAGAGETWHRDPGATAERFARDFLGYGDIGRVTSTRLADDGAHIGVGYLSPEGGRLATAAVVHLVRYGSGADAPWEVVGTDDRPTFTLTRPAYGAVAGSPVRVGGAITGVDESIVIEIHQPSTATPLGRSCCLPAGGEGYEWNVTVAFDGATDPVLTVSAATGGHVTGVERFAVTGVRAG